MRSSFLLILAITCLILISYAASIEGSFIWDEEYLITNNTYIRSISSLRAIFTQSMAQGSGVEYHYYRPLQIAFYCIDYAIAGLDPKIYHMINILWHWLGTLLLGYVVYLFTRDTRGAFFASLIFAIHPVHTEVVCYIPARADSMVFAFVLVGLIAYMKYCRQRNIYFYTIVIISAVCAMLSKEHGLIFPLIIAGYHYCFRVPWKMRDVGPFFMLAIGYCILRATMLARSPLLFVPITWNVVFQRVPGFFVALARYVKLLIIPAPLHMGYGNEVFSIMHPFALAGIVIGIAILCYIVRMRDRSPLVSFGLFWFCAGLVPVNSVYPQLPFYMAERYLYISSAGFCVILGHYISRVLREQKARPRMYVMLSMMIMLFTLLTIKQVTYWHDPVTFYQHIARYAPDNFRVQHNLGNVLYQQGKYQDACDTYLQAARIMPEDAQTRYDLGVTFSALGDNVYAEHAYREAIILDPAYVMAYNNLGVLYSKMGNMILARQMFQKALEHDTENPQFLYNIGLTYHAENNKDMAQKYFATAEKLGVINENTK